MTTNDLQTERETYFRETWGMINPDEVPEGHVFPEPHQLIPRDLRLQVSVYAVSRHYGGPEEGGWWYNWYTFTGVSERVYPEQIDEARDRLTAMFQGDQPRYDIYSAANNGPQYEALVEIIAGSQQTKERPHYE